jgi:hypothetical protein
VTALVYLRRHDAWAESLYRELIIKGKLRQPAPKFGGWLRRSEARLNFNAHVEVLRDVFDDVEVRGFEHALAGAGVVNDFFAALGIARPDSAQDEHLRSSPDARVVIWMRRNLPGTWEQRARFATSAPVRDIFPDYGVPTLWRSEEERAAFLSRFDGPYGASYFPSPRPLPPHARLTPQESDALDKAWEAWRTKK